MALYKKIDFVFNRRCLLPFDAIENLRFHQVQEAFEGTDYSAEKEVIFNSALREMSRSSNHRASVSFANYYKRAAGRSVPISTFVGCSLGKLVRGKTGWDKVSTQGEAIQRLEADETFKVYQALLEEESFEPRFPFYVNPTLSLLGKELTYQKLEVREKGFRFHPVVLKLPLNLTAELIRNPGKRLTHKSLRESAKLKGIDTKELMRDLSNEQVITPVYYPNPGVSDQVQEWKKYLHFNSSQKKILSECVTKTKTPLFYRDSSQMNVSSEVADHVSRVLGLLTTFQKGHELRSTEFEVFFQEFKSLYGHSPISLLEALNPRNGLTVNNVDLWANNLDTIFFHDQLEKLHSSDCREQDITPLLQSGNLKTPNLPTNAVLGTAFGDEFYLKHVLGDNPTKLLGRFTHDWQELSDFISSQTMRDCAQNPDVIFAEVTLYMPGECDEVTRREAATGPRLNCLSAFRPGDIPLSDIQVICDDQEIYLYHKLSRKRVIPIHFHMLDCQHPTPPVYKFLIGLARRTLLSVRIPSWFQLGDRHYLPRIRAGSVILSPEKWRMRREDFIKGLEQGTLAESHNMPTWVMIGQQDRLLPFNIHDPSWADCAKKILPESIVTVSEMLPAPELLPTSEGRHFVSEQVLFFQPEKAPVFQHPALPDLSRKSQAVFWEIPCRPELYLSFVFQELLPWLRRHELESSFWVFIKDKDHHIRLRFLNLSRAREQKLVKDFATASKLWERQKWTRTPRRSVYHQEWLSYGGAGGVRLLERYSQLDSLIMSSLSTASVPEFKTLFSVGVYSILFNTLHLSSSTLEGLELVIKILDAKKSIHTKMNFPMKEIINGIRRGSNHKELATALGVSATTATLLEERKKILENIRKGITDKAIKISLEAFLERINHLSCNRLGIPESLAYRCSIKIIGRVGLAENKSRSINLRVNS